MASVVVQADTSADLATCPFLRASATFFGVAFSVFEALSLLT
jgi:hypothetical protein